MNRDQQTTIFNAVPSIVHRGVLGFVGLKLAFSLAACGGSDDTLANVQVDGAKTGQAATVYAVWFPRGELGLPIYAGETTEASAELILTVPPENGQRVSGIGMAGLAAFDEDPELSAEVRSLEDDDAWPEPVGIAPDHMIVLRSGCLRTDGQRI